MKYLDTGARESSQTVAKWFEDVLQDEVAELRVQTGFFSLDGIGLLVPMLVQSAKEDRIAKILIGSNDASTLHDDVAELVGIMGIPRKNAHLGVVSFGGAYFHPKVYHIRREDGSEAAFVGSANLTASGLALHVEAGIALDTRDGDAPYQLSQIAAAIDAWFNEKRDGLTLVNGLSALHELVKNGVLAVAPLPRSSPSGKDTAGSPKSARPRLRPIFTLPRVKAPKGIAQDEADVQLIIVDNAQPVSQPAAVPAAHQAATPYVASVPRDGFPPYLLFEPNSTEATAGASAMSGTQLPGGASGLIIQLNKDSARHFMGGTGTANISIPVSTVATLRFGIYGKHGRPRGEYALALRYVGDKAIVDGGSANTNVMGYGYTEKESGHGDIRMLVPTEVRNLGAAVKQAGMALPTAGDLALLEWPTLQQSSFRLTFLESDSAIAKQASALFNAAIKTGEIVGNGACWLAAGLSPAW